MRDCVICINNDSNPASLNVDKVYRTLSDVEAVAHDMLRERRRVFGELRRLGLLCLETRPHLLGPALLNQYLLIKSRGLL